MRKFKCNMCDKNCEIINYDSVSNILPVWCPYEKALRIDWVEVSIEAPAWLIKKDGKYLDYNSILSYWNESEYEATFFTDKDEAEEIAKGTEAEIVLVRIIFLT